MLYYHKTTFGAIGDIYVTIHKDEARKQSYINRHKNNENWTESGINTPGLWKNKLLLWNLSTISAIYQILKEIKYIIKYEIRFRL